MRFKFYRPVLALMAILALLAVFLSPRPIEAANLKRPVTLKYYAKQHFAEWTGTMGMTSSDNLILYSDTSGTPDGIPPLWFLQTDASQYWSGAVYPKRAVPEKLCISMAAYADADSSLGVWQNGSAATPEGTRVIEAPSVSGIYPGVTVQGNTYGLPFVPNRYLTPKLTITDATDTLTISRITLWPCDD